MSDLICHRTLVSHVWEICGLISNSCMYAQYTFRQFGSECRSVCHTSLQSCNPSNTKQHPSQNVHISCHAQVSCSNESLSHLESAVQNTYTMNMIMMYLEHLIVSRARLLAAGLHATKTIHSRTFLTFILPFS